VAREGPSLCLINSIGQHSCRCLELELELDRVRATNQQAGREKPEVKMEGGGREREQSEGVGRRAAFHGMLRKNFGKNTVLLSHSFAFMFFFGSA
jgi:hypothetical protein